MTQCKNGVSVWSVVEPIDIDFEVDVPRFITCKDGTIKPPDTIGIFSIPRVEAEARIRCLIAEQNLSISQVAKELEVSVTTVRRVCRTLKIGPYTKASRAIVSRSSQVPFGWDVVQGHLQVSPTEWVWVEKIHELRSSGTSLHKIAAVLSEQNVPTKNGGRWFAKSVSQILDFNRPHLIKLKNKRR